MTHLTKVRIYYEDTDCGGVVYYANYLRYFERARTEFLESRGVSIKQLMSEGTSFVVTEANLKYIGPAIYGDTLWVETWVDKVGPASMVFGHNVSTEQGKKIVEGAVKVGCVGRDLRPQRMAHEIRRAVSQ